jgi:hypothetical protein
VLSKMADRRGKGRIHYQRFFKMDVTPYHILVKDHEFQQQPHHRQLHDAAKGASPNDITQQDNNASSSGTLMHHEEEHKQPLQQALVIRPLVQTVASASSDEKVVSSSSSSSSRNSGPNSSRRARSPIAAIPVFPPRPLSVAAVVSTLPSSSSSPSSTSSSAQSGSTMVRAHAPTAAWQAPWQQLDHDGHGNGNGHDMKDGSVSSRSSLSEPSKSINTTIIDRNHVDSVTREHERRAIARVSAARIARIQSNRQRIHDMAEHNNMVANDKHNAHVQSLITQRVRYHHDLIAFHQ